MNHESANNSSRQNTISIVTRPHIVKPTDLGFTPRKARVFPGARNMPTGYATHTAHCWLSAGDKVAGMETDRNGRTSKMKDKRYITPFPVSFVQREFYINLLLKSGVIGTLMRGYIKVRNLCVSLDLRMTFHSAALWIYQVLVLFIALINNNQ